MFISMNWISDFVDLSGVDFKQLISRFTLSTAEVEDVYEYGGDVKNVVVGKIVSMENHPNSKKLHLIKVFDGENTVDCVCGAPNIFEGALVPFARCGGSVKGMEIKAAEVAGYKSFGMCCSEKELGISEDHSGVMILQDVEPGTDIKSFMDIEDTIFEVDNKSLTNRPDLWGHYGIARELAALVGRPLRELPVKELKEYDSLQKVDVRVETEQCYRYSCMTVENVTKTVSPINMKIRLTYCGQRPINLLADLTNYLMLELGQPMHAFDNDKVKEIRVKTFDNAFEFETLDGAKRNIEPGIMMICNETEPTAVAGVMGGLLSEIEDDTTKLLLESANFDGVAVRKNATKLGMRTEASARYEKTLDPEMTVPAIARFLKLLEDIDDGMRVTSSLTDVYTRKYDTIEISFDKAYVDKYTGIDISSDRIEATLLALDFKVQRDSDGFKVTVPSFRATKDVTIKADIIEEITRIYGYDNFELKSTASLLTPVRQDRPREDEYSIKQLLAEHFAFSEVHSYIWYDNKTNRELGIEAGSDVAVVNSLAGDCEAIRQSIIPMLLGFVNKNLDYSDELKMFESGRVVKGMKADGLVNERKTLSLVISSRKRKENEILAELKEVLEYISSKIKHQMPVYTVCSGSEGWIHPKNSADINLKCKGELKKIGYISVLNPRIADKIDKKLKAAVLEIDYTDFAETDFMPVVFKETSKFPGISIDLSLVIDKTVHFSDIVELVNSAQTEYLAGCSFIDTFEDDSMPEGKHSMTIRLQFVSCERTLSGDEVNGYVQNILRVLKDKDISLRD